MFFRTRTASMSGQRGYSLIELLMVVALVGIFAAIGISFMPVDRMQTREAARVLAADMNRARTEAIRLNTNVAIDFENGACTSYCIYADYGRTGSPDGNLDGDAAGTQEMSQPLLLDRKMAQDFPRVAVASADFGTSKRIWFDVRGLPRASTGAYFGSTGQVVLRPRKGGSGYIVTLEPQGRVQVQAE